MISEEHEVLAEMGYHDLIERFPHEMVEVSVKPFEFGTFIVEEKMVVFSGEYQGLHSKLKNGYDECRCKSCRNNTRNRYFKSWKQYRSTKYK